MGWQIIYGTESGISAELEFLLRLKGRVISDSVDTQTTKCT